METTEQLEQQMYELRSQRIFLSTQLSLEMDGYWNNVPSSKENMDKLREELNAIDNKLMPLQEKYERHFNHYYIRFSSEIPDMYGRLSRHVYHNYMRSKVDCNIDTTKEKVDLTNKLQALELVNDLAKSLYGTYNNIRFEVIVKQNRPTI
jgi:predicted  nucleic acid-binding Zn-ribbon protein